MCKLLNSHTNGAAPAPFAGARCAPLLLSNTCRMGQAIGAATRATRLRAWIAWRWCGRARSVRDVHHRLSACAPFDEWRRSCVNPRTGAACYLVRYAWTKRAATTGQRVTVGSDST